AWNLSVSPRYPIRTRTANHGVLAEYTRRTSPMKISFTAALWRRCYRFLLPAAACLASGAALGPAAAQEEPAAVVEMTNALQFAPQQVEVAVGDAVEWRNVSGVVHTVTADPALASDPSFVSLPEGAESFDSGSIAPD